MAAQIYTENLSITIDGENPMFHGEVKFKQYLLTEPVMQKVLKRKCNPRRLTTPMKIQVINNLAQN